MHGVGVLQVHEIGSRRFLYKKVVEVQSNYKKSYFWWFGNLACGELTGSSRTGKNKGRASARLASGTRRERAV